MLARTSFEKAISYVVLMQGTQDIVKIRELIHETYEQMRTCVMQIESLSKHSKLNLINLKVKINKIK